MDRQLQEKVARAILMIVIKTTLWTTLTVVLLKLSGHPIVHTYL